MTEQTLKYKHQLSCPANKPKQPKQPKTKDIKAELIVDIEDINIDPPPMLPLKRSPPQSTWIARQTRINRKQEQYNSLIVNAFWNILYIIIVYNNAQRF